MTNLKIDMLEEIAKYALTVLDKPKYASLKLRLDKDYRGKMPCLALRAAEYVEETNPRMVEKIHGEAVRGARAS